MNSNVLMIFDYLFNDFLLYLDFSSVLNLFFQNLQIFSEDIQDLLVFILDIVFSVISHFFVFFHISVQPSFDSLFEEIAPRSLFMNSVVLLFFF
jgi:hypothetical protein